MKEVTHREEIRTTRVNVPIHCNHQINPRNVFSFSAYQPIQLCSALGGSASVNMTDVFSALCPQRVKTDAGKDCFSNMPFKAPHFDCGDPLISQQHTHKEQHQDQPEPPGETTQKTDFLKTCSQSAFTAAERTHTAL